MPDAIIRSTMKEIFPDALPAVEARHEIASRLKSAIESGLLRPGYRIKQQALANICNVSRMPVREALRALSVQGYLECQANKGCVVAAVLPNQTSIHSLQQLIAPLKSIYNLLESPEVRDQFEQKIIAQLRSAD
jgi:DNA-binding FadR family transcriptional regulator